MNKTLISAIALSSALLASPALAKDGEYHYFLGAAAGTSGILDEKGFKKEANKSTVATHRLTDVDTSGTAYKITGGYARNNLRFGVEYIDWGDVKTTFGTGDDAVTTTTKFNSFGPWIGYNFSRFDGFDVIPKLGVAFGEEEATVNNRKIELRETGLTVGIELAYNINDRFAVTVGYDAISELNMVSAGFRYSYR